MRSAAGTLGIVVLAACGSFGESAPETSAPDAAVADGGAPDGGDDATTAAKSCPSGRGSPMVLVDDYCIDVREATNAEYAAFAASTPPLPKDALCGWKTSFAPSCGETGTAFPISCVDWCDARAFCAWAGKRLCRGRRGVALTGTASDPTASEWAFACVDRDLTQSFPYGRERQDDACNTAGGPGSDGIAAPQAYTKCKGTLGAYDLLGNVIEWVDDCAPGNSPIDDTCWTVGDSFRFTAAPGDGKCTNKDTNPRKYRADDLGIRCCADALP